MDEEDYAKQWATFRERLDRGDPEVLAAREHVRRLSRRAPRDVVPPTDAELAEEGHRRRLQDENIALLHGLPIGPRPFDPAGLNVPLGAHGFAVEMPLEDDPFPQW